MTAQNAVTSESEWQALFLTGVLLFLLLLALGVDHLELCYGNPQHELFLRKPLPMRWSAYLLSCLRFDSAAGRRLAQRCVAETLNVLTESLSTLDELVLDGDEATARYQIEQELRCCEDTNLADRERSVIHFAVLSGNVALLEMLLQHQCGSLVQRHDYITGFTPLHLAFVTQHRTMAWRLLQHGALFSARDNYNATALDYGRLLGMWPSQLSTTASNTYFNVYDNIQHALTKWTIPDFEKAFGVRWEPTYSAGFDYIEELLFAGLQLGNLNEEFRLKYGSLANSRSWEKELVICKIDEKVGHGVFALKDFKPDDFICRYSGRFSREDDVPDRSYSVACKLEGFVLDASHDRNIGALINHSRIPNAEIRSIFEKGVQETLVIALVEIPCGTQIFLDYSGAYFEDSNISFEEMPRNEFPGVIPQLIKREL